MQFSGCARKLWLTGATHVMFLAGNSSHSTQFPYHSFTRLTHGVSRILFHPPPQAHTHTHTHSPTAYCPMAFLLNSIFLHTQEVVTSSCF